MTKYKKSIIPSLSPPELQGLNLKERIAAAEKYKEHMLKNEHINRRKK